MPPHLLGPLVAAAVLLQEGDPGVTRAREVVARALAAVEAGTAAPLIREWRPRARRGTDPSATLGLATLARLGYDYLAADSLYATLLAAPPPDDATRLFAALGMGQSLTLRDRLGQARVLLERALTAARRIGSPDAEVEAGTALAGVRLRRAGPGAAESLLDSLPVALVRDSSVLASWQCRRAVAQLVGGKPGGRDGLRVGARTAERAGARRVQAACWMAEAQALAAIGEIEEAGSLYQRVLTLTRATHDRAQTAAALSWLGFLYASVDNLGSAYRHLQSAIAESRATGFARVEGYAHLNLGNLLEQLGDDVSALASIAEARRLLEAVGDPGGLRGVAWAEGRVGARLRGDPLGPDRPPPTAPGRLDYYRQRGQLAAILHRWDEALRAYEQALAASRAPGLDRFGLALLPRIAHAALAMDDLDRAERALRASARYPEQPARNYARMLLWAELYARTGRLPSALDSVVAAEGSLHRFRLSLPESELRLLSLQGAGLPGDPDLGAATVIARLAREGTLEDAFRIADGRRSRELHDRIVKVRSLQADSAGPGLDQPVPGEPGTIEAVQGALLDHRTAFLEFVTGRGGEPTTLFVITKARAAAVALPPIDSLTGALSTFRVLLEDGLDATALGQRLGALLLGPALAGLDARVDRLIVVPDDVLHRIPLDALRDGEGRLLVERFAVDLAPSAGIYLALRGRPPPGGRGVLAVGDPLLTTSPGAARLGLSAGLLPPLPASRSGARAVARYGRPGTALTGARATEAALEGSLRDYHVIHFGTHAVVDDRTLLRSALVLTPAGDDDGLLFPGELSRLRLDAGLVVLAACRSAGGVLIGGEGVWGLTGPLLAAGARSVVATAWNVEDRSAAGFVEGFYDRLAAGGSPSDALRATKLAAIRNGATPSTWAAYRLFGVGDAPLGLQAPSPTGRMVIIGLAVLVLAGLVYLVRWKRRATDRLVVPSARAASTHQR